MSPGSPTFQLRLNAAEKAEVEALAERWGTPKATAVKLAVRVVLRLGVDRLADENLPLDDSRPAVTGREDITTEEESLDVLQAYLGPQARITTAR